MTRKILVTSALPYANGSIHLGHMVEHIQTDVWVRFQKTARPRMLPLLRRRHPRHACNACRAKTRHCAWRHDCQSAKSTPPTLPVSISATTIITAPIPLKQTVFPRHLPRAESQRAKSKAASSSSFRPWKNKCSCPTASSKANAPNATPRPIRRQLRSRWHDLFPDRTDQPVFRRFRCQTRIARIEHFLQTGRMRRLPQSLDFRQQSARRQALSVTRKPSTKWKNGWAKAKKPIFVRLGTSPRRAVFRFLKSRRAGQNTSTSGWMRLSATWVV